MFSIVLYEQIGVLAVLLTTVAGMVSIDDIWRGEWDIILISLQVRTHSFTHSVMLHDVPKTSL